MISREQIEAIETNYRERFEVEGLTMVRWKEGLGTTYDSSNDMALWTGVRLGQLAIRYAAEYAGDGDLDKTVDDCHRVMQAVLKLLTVTGTPGVLARWAFPLTFGLGPWHEIGYDPELSLRSEGNTFGDRIRAGNLYENEEITWAFETRTTRDQLSGILFGLTCAWTHCLFLKEDVQTAVMMLAGRLRDTDFSLKDHTGSTGGTSAHKADSAQVLIVRSLLHTINPIEIPKPSSCWFRWIWLVTAHYNRRWQNTYSHLLNSLDAHSLLLLSEHHKEEKGVRKWWERIWNQMASDNSPHFEAIHQAFTGEPMSTKAQANLAEGYRRNYPGYYRYNRSVEDWYPEKPVYGPQLCTLLPYWMQEYWNAEANR